MSEIFDEESLKLLAGKIDNDARELVQRHQDDLIAEEEDYTQLVVSMLKGAINGYTLRLRQVPRLSYGYASPGSVRLAATAFDGRPMSRKGGESEESLTGADMMLVFKTDGIEGLAEQKGILVQAKKRDTQFRKTSDKGLIVQCKQMSEITDDCFALIYALNGIHVFGNAHKKSVLNASESDFSLGQLVAKFVSCEVGDRSLHELRKGRFAPAAAELRKKRLREAAAKAEANLLVVTAEPN